jgi:hypothetical protein
MARQIHVCAARSLLPNLCCAALQASIAASVVCEIELRALMVFWSFDPFSFDSAGTCKDY